MQFHTNLMNEEIVAFMHVSGVRENAFSEGKTK